MFNKLLLYWHTLKYLRFKQIAYRLYYFIDTPFLKRASSFTSPAKEYSSDKVLDLLPSLYTHPGYLGNLSFQFLNLQYTFQNKIDWDYAELGKLWTYNLNYFEFLCQEDMDKKTGIHFIHQYIAAKDHIKTGFEPYPVSLRLLYTIRFLIRFQIKDEIIDQCLFEQAKILCRRLEYHLLGNHLLENGFGLLFAGYYFHNESFYSLAKKILAKEMQEQILPDGAHFELSPMYHQLMLYRVLDSINLVFCNAIFQQELLPLLMKKAGRMLGWLQQVTFSNGDIPLVNDAAFKINPTTSQLTKYASRLGIIEEIVPLAQSGYRKINKSRYELLLDIGPIGPDYIPGHAHSDIFNFELHLDGQPFIVDTGTSTYHPGPRRNYERSTSAHNVVQVGDMEQSEVWGSFRVARRSKGIILEESENRISGVLHSYHRVYHNSKRTFCFGEDQIMIADAMPHNDTSSFRLHFHPGVDVKLADGKIITSKGNITFVGLDNIELKDYKYAPEFNILIPAKKVEVHFKKTLETYLHL